MKYYTKKFYQLLENSDYTYGLRINSGKTVDDLYQDRLKEYIKEARERFDTPLFYLDPQYHSEDELVNQYASVVSKLYQNRGQFDEEEVIEEFEALFQLKKESLNYPLEIAALVNVDELALGYVSKEVYELLTSLEQANQIQISSIIAEEERNREASMQGVVQMFDLEECLLVDLKMKDSTLLLDFELCDEVFSHMQFELNEARVLENELGEIFDCILEKTEVYSINDGMEIHMIYNCLGEYKYLTVYCTKIIRNIR